MQTHTRSYLFRGIRTTFIKLGQTSSYTSKIVRVIRKRESQVLDDLATTFRCVYLNDRPLSPPMRLIIAGTAKRNVHLAYTWTMATIWT